MPGSFIRHRLLDGEEVAYCLDLPAQGLRAALGSYVDGPTWERNGYITGITRTRGGQPTREFIARWASHVRSPDEAGSS